MMHRCPACNLPITPDRIGATFAATSSDQAHHGVVGVCRRCYTNARRLPISTRSKLIDRAADRALLDPGKYLCSTFPTIEAATLAAAMTQHAQLAQETLNAIGWGIGTARPD
jgi:hypothetical protein